MVYVGTADSQIRVSVDGGKNYSSNFAAAESGAVERFWADPNDPRIAVAVLSSRSTSALTPSPAVHVLRTINGGALWDDITANLPDTAVRGVTADRASKAVYVATNRGVFYASVNLETLGSPVSWDRLAGLPEASRRRCEAR